jgi:hypothetical protein
MGDHQLGGATIELTMSSDPLAGARKKIERAKYHLSQLEGAVEIFLQGGPYDIDAQIDADGLRNRPYRVVRAANPPLDIPAITGEVLNSLRSVLDHIAYGAVWVGLNGQHPAKPTTVEYPIAESAAAYPGLRNRGLGGARQDALDAIDKTEPYKGGQGEVLWRLNKLNNIDKHRFLLTVGAAFVGADFGPRMAADMKAATGRDVAVPSFFLKPTTSLFPLEVGQVVEFPTPFEPHPKVQFLFDIALGEPEILHGEPLLKTVHQIVDAVDALLPAFVGPLS